MNYEFGHIFFDFVMKNIIYNFVDRVVLNVQLVMLYLMMIHLSDIHIIIHVGTFFMLY